MMNLDQARAGGEGLVGAKKNKEGKDKNVELEETPSVFQTEEKKLNIAIPEGWKAKEA